MSSFPGSPKVMKGAIIGLDSSNPLAKSASCFTQPDTIKA